MGTCSAGTYVDVYRARSTPREGLGREGEEIKNGIRKVKTFTDSNFDEEMKTGVCSSTSEHGGPCRRLAPTVMALATGVRRTRHGGEVERGRDPNIPDRFIVRGIPTMLLVQER